LVVLKRTDYLDRSEKSGLNILASAQNAPSILTSFYAF